MLGNKSVKNHDTHPLGEERPKYKIGHEIPQDVCKCAAEETLGERAMRISVKSVGIMSLLLGLSNVAIAEFDVSLREKTVFIVSADNKPVANTVQTLWVEASHYRLGLCGERIPLPGTCWQIDHLMQSEQVSDSKGEITIEASQFKKDSSNWRDLEIKLMTYGIRVPQCKPRPHERYYSITISNECDQYNLYNSVLHIDLTQRTEVTCRYSETIDQINAKIAEALRTCER